MEDNHILKSRHIISNQLSAKIEKEEMEKLIKNRLINHISTFLSDSKFLKINKEDCFGGMCYTLELAIMNVEEYKKLKKLENLLKSNEQNFKNEGMFDNF